MNASKEKERVSRGKNEVPDRGYRVNNKTMGKKRKKIKKKRD